MGHIVSISPTKDHFLRDGARFFYLADTVWRAVSRARFEDWITYLDFRAHQGFNSLQISLTTGEDVYARQDGTRDLARVSEVYVARARRMFAAAVDRGFTLALVLLWGNRVPDTWQSKRNPQGVMPFAAIRPFTEQVVDAFAEFNPIYLVGGDTDFGSAETTEHYLEAMHAIKERAPDTLITIHTWADECDYPEEIAQSPLFDYYMYQSGHWIDGQDLPYRHAQRLYHDYQKRPIVNGEPCYEGHCHHLSDKSRVYGTMRPFNIRKAVWQSLLSGAKAGVTYGAMGLWNWNAPGTISDQHRANPAGYGFDWRTAMHFPGAWDVTFARWLFETYDLFDIEPMDVVENETPEIRAAGSDRIVVIYVPYSTDVRLSIHAEAYTWTAIDLAERHFGVAEVGQRERHAAIRGHTVNADVLLIGQMNS